MEAELVCKICHNLFNNPVLLPCGHSLCLGCAETYYRYVPETGTNKDMLCVTPFKVAQGYSVRCPVCGFGFSLPVGGVYGLVKNSCMLGVMAKVEASRGIRLHPCIPFERLPILLEK